MSGLAASDVRARMFEEHAEQRNREAACALDFRVYGEETHAERCICKPRCSLDYDPLPYPATYSLADGMPSVITARDKALPAGDALYRGTGIGALYGLGMETLTSGVMRDGVNYIVTRSFAPYLAGWNLRKESK